MWKPFKAKEGVEEEEEGGMKMENKEKDDVNNDDASLSTFSPTLRGERTNGEGEENIKMLSRD